MKVILQSSYVEDYLSTAAFSYSRIW